MGASLPVGLPELQIYGKHQVPIITTMGTGFPLCLSIDFGLEVV